MFIDIFMPIASFSLAGFGMLSVFCLDPLRRFDEIDWRIPSFLPDLPFIGRKIQVTCGAGLLRIRFTAHAGEGGGGGGLRFVAFAVLFSPHVCCVLKKCRSAISTTKKLFNTRTTPSIYQNRTRQDKTSG